MRNALILGGTGMLRDLSLKLLEDQFQVFLVARHADALANLQEDAGALARYLTLAALDYHQYDRLARWVAHVQLMNGPIDRVVAWIHGDNEPVLDVVDREVALYRQSSWDLYHVLGIRAGVEVIVPPRLSPNCRYHRVILGYVPSMGASRWLTHREIVEGVYGALNHGSEETVVGQIHPYDARPRS